MIFQMFEFNYDCEKFVSFNKIDDAFINFVIDHHDISSHINENNIRINIQVNASYKGGYCGVMPLSVNIISESGKGFTASGLIKNIYSVILHLHHAMDFKIDFIHIMDKVNNGDYVLTLNTHTSIDYFNDEWIKEVIAHLHEINIEAYKND
jgi:hypothetical protein